MTVEAAALAVEALADQAAEDDAAVVAERGRLVGSDGENVRPHLGLSVFTGVVAIQHNFQQDSVGDFWCNLKSKQHLPSLHWVSAFTRNFEIRKVMT